MEFFFPFILLGIFLIVLLIGGGLFYIRERIALYLERVNIYKTEDHHMKEVLRLQRLEQIKIRERREALRRKKKGPGSKKDTDTTQED